MSDHDFCRTMLAETRAEAKEKNVVLPVSMSAIKSSTGLWFVQGRKFNGHHDDGEYVKADCAYHAKAMRISELIEEHDAKKGESNAS